MDKKILAWIVLLVASYVLNGAQAAGEHEHQSDDQTCMPTRVQRMHPMNTEAIPPLPEGKRPNFIIIMTDDQGWDDIGLHNPRYVNTPNMDRFIRQGALFDNFYVSPQCAQTRASLLTGRNHPRTGVMLVHGGYDFINSNEATSGKVMSEAGYKTVHIGKWHNNNIMGYEPWSVGFMDSFYPSSPGKPCMLCKNGTYWSKDGYLEDTLMDTALAYLRQQLRSDQPFYMSYTPHAIHLTSRRSDGNEGMRDYPPRFKIKLQQDPKYKDIADTTLDAWASLEYFDGVLGRLFDFLDRSNLGKSTYVMLLSDNGSYLAPGTERDEGSQIRMPSKMVGSKNYVSEGGIRNWLAVRGPGVQPGVTDSSLLDIVDILPTMADLAGVNSRSISHMPWDGLSFKNLLRGHTLLPASVRSRGKQLSSDQQKTRFLFSLAPNCWGPDAVPKLGPDREVLKPQPLLDYDAGGSSNPLYALSHTGLEATPKGFKACIAVRYKEFKWLGLTDKLYRLIGDSHIELPCNELTESQSLKELMSSAARRWWYSLLAEPHSFNKPTFYIGLASRRISNVVAMGAHERTPGNIKLLPNGASGFQEVGDRMCFKVQVLHEGTYNVTLVYTSNIAATFKLSLGTFDDIMAGSAPSTSSEMPAQSTMHGQLLGLLTVPLSEGRKTEACLELVRSTDPGRPVFTALSNIRLYLRRPARRDRGDRRGPPSSNATVAVAADGMLAVSGTATAELDLETAATATAAAAEPEAERSDLSTLRVVLRHQIEASQQPVTAAEAWRNLRKKCKWPTGQGVFENMYSPYDSEGIDDCPECQPAVE